MLYFVSLQSAQFSKLTTEEYQKAVSEVESKFK